MKLFLDANVLFTAAHNPDGKASFVIEMGDKSHWQVVTSELAIEEARRNLEIKFPESLQRFEKLMMLIGVVPTVAEGNCPIELPTKDESILLSTIASRCSHLLTGDRKDFGRFMNRPEKTEGIVIQTVSDFLAAL